ncbi:hypothetical protein BIV57_09630 [Mangrovactinospora gilvigrisea]|uniref:Alpha/beta hydrolase n=1 Tax=Mangrovactinospora gilvigrisea TaxID=1428644 RepID=A0A1J7BGW7_9ACTN|nr:hypothetical protein BIV57_09630 [Mangrovactinospora gilvigrisea]
MLDVDAAVSWARSLGYRRIVTVGFSMGAAVVLRHAALCRGLPGRTDAAAAVSSPGRWYYKGTRPMRLLHWAVQRPEGRLFSRWVLGTRIARDWEVVPMPPRIAAREAAEAGVPLLIVHGDADRYFPLAHGTSLHEATGGRAELWVEPGMGHAENAVGEELLARLAGWLRRAVLATGAGARVPSAPDHRGPSGPQETKAGKAGGRA